MKRKRTSKKHEERPRKKPRLIALDRFRQKSQTQLIRKAKRNIPQLKDATSIGFNLKGTKYLCALKKKAFIVDVNTNKIIQTYKRHKICGLSDRIQLATAFKHSIHIWNVRTQQLVRTIPMRK